jgi:hypothetical protein
MHYVLINIQPKISDFLIQESHIDPQAKAGLKELADRNHKQSMKILDESMEIMIKLGINKKLIEKVSLPALKGTSKEILDYAKQTICDAVVVETGGYQSLRGIYRQYFKQYLLSLQIQFLYGLLAATLIRERLCWQWMGLKPLLLLLIMPHLCFQETHPLIFSHACYPQNSGITAPLILKRIMT